MTSHQNDRLPAKTLFFSARFWTRYAHDAIACLCCVLLLLLGGLSFRPALAHPTSIYPSTKTYLEQHLNSSLAPHATESGGRVRRFARSLGIVPAAPPKHLCDTGQYIYVKYTVADKNHLPQNPSFQSIFKDPNIAGNAICAQYETLANVYDTGAGDNFVAFVDNSKITNAAEVLDFQFAEANLEGKVVPGVRYDAQTGIVYIPKSLYQADGTTNFRPFSAQLLFTLDLSRQQQMDVSVHITSNYFGVAPVQESTMLSADPLACSLTVPVVDAGDASHLSLKNFKVHLGDSERPLELRDQQNASYDPKTGELNLLLSPLTLSTIHIHIVPNSAAEVALNAISLPTPAYAANAQELGMWPYGKFDKLDLQTLKVGQVFSYKSYIKYDANADQFSNIPWANKSVLRTLQYIYSSFENRPGNDAVGSTNWIFRQIKGGATWEQIAPYIESQPVSSHVRDVNFLFSLPGDYIANKDGTWNTMLEGQNFRGLTSPCFDVGGEQASYICAPAFCSHIKQPANRLFNIDEKDGRWGTTTMHILKIQTEGNNPYVLIGFCTPQVTTQSGVAVIKFGIRSQGSLEVEKTSAASAITTNNDSYTLKGATFELLAADKSTHVANLVTNEEGIARKDNLASGTYFLKEVTSPYGFIATSTLHEVRVEPNQVAKITLPNTPIADASWDLAQKLDSKLGTTPQGSATLAGARFKVQHFSNIHGNTAGTALKTWILQSDATGKVKVDKNHFVEGDSLYELGGKTVMPLGTYTLTEIAPPKGYQLSERTTHVAVLTASQDGAVWQNSNGWNHPLATSSLGRGVVDEVVCGGVEIEKQDAEGLANRGAGSLLGTTFSIKYQGTNPISVDGVTYQADQTVLTITTKRVVQNGRVRFVATTPNNILPVGDYSISESAAGAGYLASPNEQRFSITGPHKQQLVLTPAKNQIIRGHFRLNKVNESMQPLAGIPFLITATDNADGDGAFEQHLLVTDANGIIDTSLLTPNNANDAALIDNQGALSVDEKSLDPQNGVWFCGRTDEACKPDPRLAAFPYGTYHVKELRCSANQGMQLVEFDLRINSHNTVVNRGTVIDAPGPWIMSSLSATDTKSKLVSPSTTTLSDRISYENLTPGKTYTLVGTLWNVQTQEQLRTKDGKPLNCRKEFTPRHSFGDVSVTFNLTQAAATPSRMVATQQLYEGDILVAEHTNLNDPDQTVHTPTLTTHASKQSLAGKDTITITDTLTYSNLVPNEHYRITTKLFDLDTQSLFQVDGADFSASTDFVPPAQDGTYSVTFDLDANILQGHRLVIFEEVSWQNQVLIVHADKNDKNQTLTFPFIRSEFGLKTEDDALNHFVSTWQEEAELVDRIAYSGLTEGETYILKGGLRDKFSQEPLTDSEGKPLGAETSFTASASSGTVEQTFTLSKPNSTAVVAFEELFTKDGELIAEDCNCEHDSQTIWIPRLQTRLAEGTTSDGLYFAAPSTNTLVDTVSYEGLDTNQTYTLVASLVDASDGKALELANNQTTVESTLKPTGSNGVTTVEFELDTQSLKGKTLVATQKLYVGDTLVAEHTDLKNTQQTVKLPALQTELRAANTDGHTLLVSDPPKLYDTVHYENLLPGNTYTVKGYLVDKASGRELAAAEQNFTPTEETGDVAVVFDLEDIPAPHTLVVAIEKLYLEDHLIAEHDDLEDPQQTVQVLPEATKEKIPKTGEAVRIAALICIIGASVIMFARGLRIAEKSLALV